MGLVWEQIGYQGFVVFSSGVLGSLNWAQDFVLFCDIPLRSSGFDGNLNVLERRNLQIGLFVFFSLEIDALETIHMLFVRSFEEMACSHPDISILNLQHRQG